MDDTTLDWLTLTLRPTPDGAEVSTEPAAPTVDRLTRVRYQLERESLNAITVTVECTEREEDLVAVLLLQYGKRWQGLCGRDRVCLHDSAFEVVHDSRCSLVAYDRLAEALMVEVGALLAENRGAEATR